MRWAVWRRYSDFSRLQKNLKKLFGAHGLPALPPKKVRFVSLSFCHSVILSLCLSVCLSVCLSLSLSLSIFISIFISMSLPLSLLLSFRHYVDVLHDCAAKP